MRSWWVSGWECDVFRQSGFIWERGERAYIVVDIGWHKHRREHLWERDSVRMTRECACVREETMREIVSV